ncbi:hypothetical protein [Lysobacter sp. Root916]|uniref:hypothetical protein n=1 Tax=Lysobacter sp. Root916 TaxID=1736606 RepID=UPI0012F772D6|nr:hypothetical protein [Lysobacter sp. Root916]
MLANLSIAVLAVIFSSQVLAATAAPQWLFVETTTGLSADLDYEGGTFGVAEDALPAKICASAEPYFCFSSSFGFEFAIPKEYKNERKWIYGGRVYCVVAATPDIKGDGVVGDTLVIKSRAGKSCDEGESYDQSYLYSKQAGLRLVTLTKAGKSIFQLISIDKRGFPHPK